MIKIQIFWVNPHIFKGRNLPVKHSVRISLHLLLHCWRLAASVSRRCRRTAHGPGCFEAALLARAWAAWWDAHVPWKMGCDCTVDITVDGKKDAKSLMGLFYSWSCEKNPFESFWWGSGLKDHSSPSPNSDELVQWGIQWPNLRFRWFFAQISFFECLFLAV